MKSISKENIKFIPLDKLRLDPENPRFGYNNGLREQKHILNNIIKNYGIDDLLGSISKNGYFSAEPLVCKIKNGYFDVIEGNRRLVTLLVISKSEIASDYPSKCEKYNKLWVESGQKQISPVPCIIFSSSEEKSLHAYLGVRHISSAKEWDSYAKAAWLSKAVKDKGLDVDSLSEMIGDTGDAVKKLIESYNVVEQLHRHRKFNPDDSQRRGRGSSSKYPFSWIYTLLGYRAAREVLGLPLGEYQVVSIEPIDEKFFYDWENVLSAMFGNKSRGKNSQLTDSRQISSLVEVIQDRKKYAWLKQGKSINEIRELSKPIEDQIHDSLLNVLDVLRRVNMTLSENEIPKDLIEQDDVPRTAREIANLSKTISFAIEQIGNSE